MDDKIALLNFSDDILNKIEKTRLTKGIISFCIELPFRDLIDIYSIFLDKYNFSILWEETNNISFLALDKCKSVQLKGPNRFQLAKDFNDKTLKNIINLESHYKFSSLTKIFYFFTFRENLNKYQVDNNFSILEGVLPKFLIINDGKNITIRMNIEIDPRISIRDNINEFWDIREKIISSKSQNYNYGNANISLDDFYKSFYKNYPLLNKQISAAIKLINDGCIEKLVLGSKLIFQLKKKLNIIQILHKLRLSQANACRYLWKRNKENMIFGASPEKLFSLKEKVLQLEAIAGTEKIGFDMETLLRSDKNLREHNFVINYLIENLKFLNIRNYKKGEIKVKKFGNIAHLCTLISAEVNKICPFVLLEKLHPSPAVCGFPKEKALDYLDSLENFDRGNYASPFGWVDVEGNADFRVALRGARILNGEIEFIAGSGLVKGSICEKEIDEIKLKLASLANLIFD
mgnify:FL=1